MNAKLTPAQTTAYNAVRDNGLVHDGNGIRVTAFRTLHKLGLVNLIEHGDGGWIAHHIDTTTPETIENDDQADSEPQVLADPVTESAAATQELTAAQAKFIVDATYSNPHNFVIVEGDNGTRIGWTFAVGLPHNLRYGWVSMAGNHGKAPQRDRHSAAAMIPSTVLDDQHLAAKQEAAPAPASPVETRTIPTRITPSQAHEEAQRVYGNSHDFVHVTDGDNIGIGYTFDLGYPHAGQYGWITVYGTFGATFEAHRATAADRIRDQFAVDESITARVVAEEPSRYLLAPSGTLHLRSAGTEDDGLSYEWARCGWDNDLGASRVPSTLSRGWKNRVCLKCKRIEP